MDRRGQEQAPKIDRPERPSTDRMTDRIRDLAGGPSDDQHEYQEYNEHGNTCHFPGCRLTEEEHRRG